ncbi:MAG: GAF domain-containing protein [Actinobacteria bacterium]|nr:GAF domain-containing protein [Actinomycetota bacterium]
MVEAVHRMDGTTRDRELRSVAQLRMLHALASRLNVLDDPDAIGEAITTELKTLIDYHSCRVYRLQDDGVTLWPVTFRGELTEYESETHEELVSQVGEGITGYAALIGETYYSPDALHDVRGYQIEGTDEIDESLLAVPMKIGDRVTGVIVLSHLGVDQFDAEDQRVLEVLASHAAVAFENASLLQKERAAAQTASALLALSQSLTGVRDISTVFERVVAVVPSILDCSAVAAYRRDPDSGDFSLVDQHGADPRRAAAARPVPAELGSRFLTSLDEPFVIPTEIARQVPTEYWIIDEVTDALIAPMRWEPDGFGAIIVLAPVARPSFSQRDLSLARGISDIAALALGSARRVSELERFQELAETLDAIFWEANHASLAFTFLSRRAETVLGAHDGGGNGGAHIPERWGDHVHPEDRARVVAELRAAVRSPGEDLDLEYRARGPEGRTLWLRDIVHVAVDVRGTPVVRGLIVDVTQGKRAEQALRKSERKYSEAFHREREATQQLRALDDMKNTFLEAVSHDLRTPLTTILGAAVTLEQAGLDMPPEDALDLLRRVASNARKLERLLSDLLDLDRLQRGIIAPNRRPTDVGGLVREAVREFEAFGARHVEVTADELFADVDAAKVERIVENLLANAARHTPPESRIWVRVQSQPDGVLLIVDDEGDGVPNHLKEQIFEPFRQGPGPARASPGVGIGLSLVARFAELHGGRAWVQDRPGGGASFRAFLAQA